MGDVAVLVPAAGRGRRMGGTSKPFLEVGRRSVLAWALQPFLDRADVIEVIVAVGPEGEGGSVVEVDGRVRTVAGGESRFESVANALSAVSEDVRIVAVHDGARPFPPPEAIEACIRIARGGMGAVAGVPATDTVKETTPEGIVVGTPDRATLWYAQTPQVFPRALLEEGVARCREAGLEPTDDAAVVEAAGGRIQMVEASRRNLKVTYPADLLTARALVEEGLV